MLLRMHVLKAIGGALVVVLLIVAVLFFFYEVELLPGGKSLNYDAFLTIMLTALGVMVALFAILVGLAAVWGYAGLRDVVGEMAKKEVASAVVETLQKYPDAARMVDVVERLERQAKFWDQLRNQSVTGPEPKSVAPASNGSVEKSVETPLESVEKQATPIAKYPGEEDGHGDSNPIG
jgi:hypothetical protein